MIILLIEKCCQFPNINNLLIFQRLLAQVSFFVVFFYRESIDKVK